MSMYRCNCCRQEKPREEFGNSRNTKDGVSVQCKACIRENSRRARERNPDLSRQAYAKHREKYLAKQKEARDACPEVQAAKVARLELRKTYSQALSKRAEKVFNRMKAHLLAPIKAVERMYGQEARRQQRLSHVAQMRAESPWINHERRAKKAPWANWDDFAAVYTEAKLLTLATGIQWDVEHIYPIKADWVCGLHTPDNLRAVPHGMNMAKGLSVDVREWPETWLHKSRVFDSSVHTQSWLEAFATTSGRHEGVTAEDLLWDLDEYHGGDMPARRLSRGSDVAAVESPKTKVEQQITQLATIIESVLAGEVAPKEAAQTAEVSTNRMYYLIKTYKETKGVSGRLRAVAARKQRLPTTSSSTSSPTCSDPPPRAWACAPKLSPTT
jgi:hypothetical protein